MTDSLAGEAREILELAPEEREAREICHEDVQAALRDVIAHGTAEEKVFVDCTFPDLDLDYQTLDGDTTHPIVFRECTFGRISAEHADVRIPMRFEDCTIDGFALADVFFEYDLTVGGGTVTGPVDAEEARFARDAGFRDTTFAAPVTMTESTFGDDTSFADATFERAAAFRGAAFHGTSNELGDNADFSGADFQDDADFQQATVEFATFERATFGATAHFEEVRFDGDADFTGVAFRGEADFDEADFGEDASFAGATFDGSAVFRGTVFEGGARTLQDDTTFADAVFRNTVNFRSAAFRYVTFDSATFAGHAMFEEARFGADADFVDAAFEDEADFDEARFDGDADFSGARFERPAVFRGAAFEGEAQHLEKNAVFEGVTFADDADFDNATFTAATFADARFGGVIDFAGAAFEELTFSVASSADDAYVDFTDAVLKEGTITQPADAWIRYDLTQASLGDVVIATERSGGRDELLDYFRFCNTEFNEFDGYEFDFSAHTYYLDRNDWTLHAFDEPAGDVDYALPMTPANAESTYLKAKNAASDGGYVKAAGEFRVQRQRQARRKHLAIARDATAELQARFSSASRAAENYFLDITCGYGMRLGRIIAVFLVAPLFPALLYTFGGRPFLTGAGQLSSVSQLATPAGRAIFYENLHFSYITFLTIGYGGIGPKGALARLLAGLEVYLSVILGGLVLYALIKRSEL